MPSATAVIIGSLELETPRHIPPETETCTMGGGDGLLSGGGDFLSGGGEGLDGGVGDGEAEMLHAQGAVAWMSKLQNGHSTTVGNTWLLAPQEITKLKERQTELGQPQSPFVPLT